MSESSADVIKRYLEEARAMEKSLEDQCRNYAAGSESTATGRVLQRCAADATRHQQSLSERLALLGAAPALGSGLLEQLFSFHLQPAQSGVEADAPAHEKLASVFATENGAIAFHEVLATMAEASSDADTEALARSIQRSKRDIAEEVWHLLATAHRGDDGVA